MVKSLKIEAFARDSALEKQAQIDFTAGAVTWVDKFNAVGSPGGWILPLNTNERATDVLLQDGSGIIIEFDGETVFSGPTTRESRRDGLTVEFSGVHDSVILSDRLCSPVPSAALGGPYSADDYDSRSGVASTVMLAYVNANVGPGAVVGRKNTLLTLDADPLVGSTVKGEGRWQPLDQMLSELSLMSDVEVGYRVVQVGSTLEFQTFLPEDRSSEVVFSLENETIQDSEYVREAGTGNYIFVGGGGEGTARVIKEGADGDSINRWRRIERFVDARDTSDTATLLGRIQEELATNSDKASFGFKPNDIPQQSYWEHYRLGDAVTVELDHSTSFVETIRQVECVLDQDGFTAKPVIGTPKADQSIRLYDMLAKASRRLNNLERR